LKQIFTLAFISLWLFSCDTENEDPCEGVLCTLYCENGYVLDENSCEMCECIVSVFAGVYDDTFIYYELPLPLEIEMVWDIENLYFSGEGSIDIDLDGNNDIKFDIGGYNEENLNEYPLIFNHCTVTTLNNFEVLYYTETFYGGMGFVANLDVVSRLDFNEGIDGSTNWYSGSNSFIRMFYENPASMPYGNWYGANGIFYIGIKKNNKYGWIKLEMFDGWPTIISYAIQN
jgi:hypothetical protein|tara:strand:- start:658 stop:1347 length:690 start_codon:yes stop_codon:yes gene_type:complete